MKKILIIEDDMTIRQPLEEFLRRSGFQVTGVGTLKEGEAQLTESFDAAIIDWNLPDGEGIDLVKKMRQKAGSPPVLMLTARTDLIDKVLGLETGAQDYLTKPYEPRELLARLKNLIQFRAGTGGPTAESLDLFDIKIDKGARTVTYQGQPVVLAKLEFDLLYLLASNPGKVFSRDELLDSIWGYDHFPSTRTVDAHVVQLREKFFPELIETVRGVGYRCKKS